jgi:hypothetical protein
MNAKILFILFALLLVSGAYSQKPGINETVYDTAAKQQILIGVCDREGLASDIFGTYYRDEYERYAVDDSTASRLAGSWQEITITVVMATWCGDSREQVGRFFKILDRTGFPTDKITLISVDKKKKGGSVLLENLDIQKVPTFIVYRNGKEAGRIIETPTDTLEKDLLLILEK